MLITIKFFLPRAACVILIGTGRADNVAAKDWMLSEHLLFSGQVFSTVFLLLTKERLPVTPGAVYIVLLEREHDFNYREYPCHCSVSPGSESL